MSKFYIANTENERNVYLFFFQQISFCFKEKLKQFWNI